MPLVDVEIVLKQHESLPKDLASTIANELGEIFNSPKGTTWVKLHEIQKNHYAENNVSQVDVHPVFVKIIKSTIPETPILEQEFKQITKAIAKICKRPAENVHIIYEPDGQGRVSFGGKLVL